MLNYLLRHLYLYRSQKGMSNICVLFGANKSEINSSLPPELSFIVEKVLQLENSMHNQLQQLLVRQLKEYSILPLV